MTQELVEKSFAIIFLFGGEKKMYPWEKKKKMFCTESKIFTKEFKLQVDLVYLHSQIWKYWTQVRMSCDVDSQRSSVLTETKLLRFSLSVLPEYKWS